MFLTFLCGDSYLICRYLPVYILGEWNASQLETILRLEGMLKIINSHNSNPQML